jgi:hypothetical protein
VARLSGVGLKIEDALETHYCADCGEPFNFWLILQQMRADPVGFAARFPQPPQRNPEERRRELKVALLEKAAWRLAALTRKPEILPGACPACGGGRIASRMGKD